MYLVAHLHHQKGFNLKYNRKKSSTLKKIEHFNYKVEQAMEILSSLEVSKEEKELLSMSLESLNEFVTTYYRSKK